MIPSHSIAWQRQLISMPIFAALLGLLGCFTPDAPTGGLGSTGSESPALAPLIRIAVGETGEEISLPTLIEELAQADAVFLGETHLDEVTHRTEHAILKGLLDATHQRVVLTMEMFTREDQAAIDLYLSGEIDERSFLRQARAWSNYQTGYRSLLETAKRAGIPVIGANLSPGPRRVVGLGGREAYESLDEEESRGIARSLFDNDPLYWERFDRAIRGHGGGLASASDRLYSVQSLWDNTMGESVADALKAHPGYRVLLVVGAFHTRGGLGTVEQFRRRAPDATVRTVSLVPVHDLADVKPESGDDRADYVIYTDEWARGFSAGTYAVSMTRELRYRLRVPEGGGPWPLLIWFPDEGSNAESDARRWQLLIGDRAAVAVIEHPYPVIEEDLHRSGRYSWDESFFEDLTALSNGLVKLQKYIERYHPIDSTRILLAGEGAGASLAAVCRWSAEDGPKTLVYAPGDLGRISESGLPDPNAPTGGKLTAIVASKNFAQWQQEVAERQICGVSGQVLRRDEAASLLHYVQGGLGFETEESISRPGTLSIEHGSPLARQWGALAAASLGGEWEIEVGKGHRREAAAAPFRLEIDLEAPDAASSQGRFTVADFVEGKGIPMPPGPFGGTVVLVLPETVSESARGAWRALEENDVTRQRSRFVGLRVAETGRERDLPSVLDELRSEGKSVIRIAPITFCATSSEMQTLRRSIQGHDEGLRIAWSPGLGGELWRVLKGEAD